MLLTAFNNTNYWQKFILSSFKAKKGNSAPIVRVRFFIGLFSAVGELVIYAIFINLFRKKMTGFKE